MLTSWPILISCTLLSIAQFLSRRFVVQDSVSDLKGGTMSERVREYFKKLEKLSSERLDQSACELALRRHGPNAHALERVLEAPRDPLVGIRQRSVEIQQDRASSRLTAPKPRRLLTAPKPRRLHRSENRGKNRRGALRVRTHRVRASR